MSSFKTNYLSDFRCESIHLQSGSKIITDAPSDNHGKGENFSPTDLVCTMVANCILTTIAIYAQNKKIILDGSYSNITKTMSTDKPRRITQIDIELFIKTNIELDEHLKTTFERVSKTCPVSKSLNPDIIENITLNYI